MLNRNKPFSIQQDLGDFRPATDKEKEYLVQMRPSTTFFRDGLKRFKKNKVAMVSFFIIVIITVGCIVIPFFQYNPVSGCDMLKDFFCSFGYFAIPYFSSVFYNHH